MQWDRAASVAREIKLRSTKPTGACPAHRHQLRTIVPKFVAKTTVVEPPDDASQASITLREGRSPFNQTGGAPEFSQVQSESDSSRLTLSDR